MTCKACKEKSKGECYIRRDGVGNQHVIIVHTIKAYKEDIPNAWYGEEARICKDPLHENLFY